MIYVYDKNHLLQTEIPFSFVEESIIKESLETGALTYVLDGVYTEETKEKFDFIKNEKYIIVPNFEGSFYEFRIKDTLKDDYKLNVYAENSALELSSRFLLPQKQQLTIREWLTLSLDGERWRPGIVESTAIRTLTIDKPTSKLSFVNEIRKSVDLDIRFRIEMKGSKVDGRYIDLIKRGNDMGVEFEYGHDLVSVKRKVNTENIYTAAIGYGTSETATSDGSQLFYFNNVEWKKTQGKPVDKPFGEYIVAIPEAFQKWNVDGRHLVYIHESDAKDSESLLQHTYEVLRRKIEQSITYEVDIVMLHRIAGYEHRKVKLGDTIAVRDKDLAWILQARILDLEQSHVNPRNDKVLIGRYREVVLTTDAKIKQAQANLSKLSERIAKSIIDKEITDVNSSVNDLNTYVDGAFKDGLISSAEATAIEKYLNTVNLEKQDLDGRYLEIYNNPDFTNATVKTDLSNKKVAYDITHAELINSINTAIADGKTTVEEKQDVDSKFASYRTALVNLTTTFEKALTSISQKQADTAKTTAINTASTDATKKANSAETNIKTGLNNATIPVSGNSIATPIPATKLNIDINIQGGNPPFTSKNAMVMGSYIAAMVPWTHNTADFLLFRHNKRFLTLELYGFWAYETEGTPPANGFCEYYLSNTQDVSGAIGGTYGTFTAKSDVVAGTNEQYREITIDLGTPTNQIRKIFVMFATRGYESNQAYRSYIRMGGRYLHD